jgi:prolipoprotein diacylglyceryltransferase
VPSGRTLLSAGGAISLLSLAGFLWFFMTYGIFDPSPAWLGPTLITGAVGGVGLLIFGAVRMVIETLRDEDADRSPS